MIVHCYRKRLFSNLLPDDILVESFPNLCRLGHANVRRLTPSVFVKLFIENAFANVNAAVTNVDPRACDKLSHFRVAFATERAHGEIRSARHMLWISALPFPGQNYVWYLHQPAIRGCAAVQELDFLPRLDDLIHQA